MIDTIEANWLVFGAALVVALLIAWWLFARASKPVPRAHRPDVLDEGVGPAQRNQALIDAAPAAQILTPPPVSGTMAGVGEVVAVAAQDAVEEVEAKVREVAPPPAPKPAHPEPVEGPAPPQPPSPQPKPEVVPQPEPAPAPQPEPAPEFEPAPEPVPAPEPLPEIEPAIEPLPVPDAPTAADDLARIKGLGPKLQALLPTLGITTFAQIAAWTDEDLARIDPQLGPFAGRPARDSWIEQAKYLAAGDVTGFEDKFGRV
jgi:predicted flap endonuclease-1-like 5' DNA nuclease